jgi:hypothetical protein
MAWCADEDNDIRRLVAKPALLGNDVPARGRAEVNPSLDASNISRRYHGIIQLLLFCASQVSAWSSSETWPLVITLLTTVASQVARPPPPEVVPRGWKRRSTVPPWLSLFLFHASSFPAWTRRNGGYRFVQPPFPILSISALITAVTATPKLSTTEKASAQSTRQQQSQLPNILYRSDLILSTP